MGLDWFSHLSRQDPGGGSLFLRKGHQIRDFHFIIMADHIIQPWDLFKFLGKKLGGTSRSYDPGSGMVPNGLPDHLGRLPLGLGGNRATVNDIEIGLFLKGNHFPAQSLKTFPQTSGFKLVDLAAQGVYGQLGGVTLSRIFQSSPLPGLDPPNRGLPLVPESPPFAGFENGFPAFDLHRGVNEP